MNKMKKTLIIIGIICAMSVSFTACEKDSNNSKLSPLSSKTEVTTEKDKDADALNKAMQDGDILFNVDGNILLDGDKLPVKDGDSSSGVGDSSKADSGATNSGESSSNDNSSGDTNSNVDSSSSGNSGQALRPEYKTIQTLWYDAALKSDISFEGEFLLFTFKIKDNAVNGTYPISFTRTDFADYGTNDSVDENGKKIPGISSKILDVKVIDGSVTVGGTAKKGETVSGSVFAMSVSNESGNAGDEVTVVLDLKNNPGFVGVDIHLQYDSNVLEVVNTSSGKDFKAAINK